jgi:hypothetical protein
LVTAATTPGDRLKPTIGCRTPSMSVRAVRMPRDIIVTVGVQQSVRD